MPTDDEEEVEILIKPTSRAHPNDGRLTHTEYAIADGAGKAAYEEALRLGLSDAEARGDYEHAYEAHVPRCAPCRTTLNPSYTYAGPQTGTCAECGSLYDGAMRGGRRIRDLPGAKAPKPNEAMGSVERHRAAVAPRPVECASAGESRAPAWLRNLKWRLALLLTRLIGRLMRGESVDHLNEVMPAAWRVAFTVEDGLVVVRTPHTPAYSPGERLTPRDARAHALSVLMAAQFAEEAGGLTVAQRRAAPATHQVEPAHEDDGPKP